MVTSPRDQASIFASPQIFAASSNLDDGRPKNVPLTLGMALLRSLELFFFVWNADTLTEMMFFCCEMKRLWMNTLFPLRCFAEADHRRDVQ